LYEETLCKREICGYDACPWKKSFFSIAQAENYNNDQKQHQEAARGGNNGTKTGHNNTNNDIGEPRDTTIRQAGDAVDSSTAEDATAQDAARIQHFAEKAAEVAGKSPEKAPTLKTDSFTNTGQAALQSDEIPRPYCYLAKVRGAAIIEYGYNGWVDPAKIAKATGILECQACRALCHLGYVQIERQGGGIGFRQKTAADAAVVA